VAFSADGRSIATGSYDGSAILWSPSRDPSVIALSHADKVGVVAYSPSGRLIVTGGDDHRARLWDAATAALRFDLPQDGAIKAVAFSRDESLLVTASDDGTARMWERQAKKSRGSLTKASSDRSHFQLMAITWSLVAPTIRLGSGARTVARKWPNFYTWIRLARSPSAQTGDLWQRAARIRPRVWDVATGKEVFRIRFEGPVRTVAFSPDGKYFAAGGLDNAASLWSMESRPEIAHLVHRGPIKIVRFSPDSRLLVTGSADNPLLAWADWKDAFRRSKRTDIGPDADYYDTYLYPDTFSESHAGNWMKLTMDSDEVVELTAGANQTASESLDLIRKAAKKSPDVSIKSLTLEVARVKIIRPWFTPNVIRSRSWEWGSAGMQPLSDGGSSPQGGMVAYATEAIFARNIDIEFAVSPVRGGGDALLAGPLKMDPASVVGDRVTSKGMQLIAFVCERTPKSPNPPAAGLISVRNKGALIARFTVKYDQGGYPVVFKSGNFPVWVTKDIPIPREAIKLSLKIEIMTLPKPVETWSTLATYNFDEPVKQLYEVWGTSLQPKIRGLPLSG
jgi:WD domain, G-beta repeat